MSEHILAIHTYGSHRIKDPQTKKTVSAHKIGYLTAAADLLLALYGSQARDVSSSRTSYRYIHISGETSVRYGYLLLKLTDTELAQAEAVTKLASRAGAYLYRDDTWQELPNQRQPEYREGVSRSGPDFNPNGCRPVAPSTGTKEAATSRITVEKSQRDPAKKAWFWIRGDTYPHRELLKQYGGRWSRKRKAWYIIAWELPDAIQQLVEQHSVSDLISSDDVQTSLTLPDDDAPCSDEEAERVLGVKLLPKPVKSAAPPEPEPVDETLPEDDKPSIRIIKPVLNPSDDSEPDAVISAIRQTKTVSLPASEPARTTQSDNHNLIRIPQAPCGELTGSITGNVWAYGWAVHEGICIYVNMGGPRMAVEAIRARLSKGEIVNCVPWDEPAVELTAGEGNTGMYTAYMQNIPEAKFTSLILCHEMLTLPNYGGKSTTFILRVSDEQAMLQLRHHVTQLVSVPVFPQWTGYLWQAGQSAMLVRNVRSQGGLDVLAVTLDVDAWTRLITGGLAENILQLPISI